MGKLSAGLAAYMANKKKGGDAPKKTKKSKKGGKGKLSNFGGKQAAPFGKK